jgi:hypothetical protein
VHCQADEDRDEPTLQHSKHGSLKIFSKIDLYGNVIQNALNNSGQKRICHGEHSRGKHIFRPLSGTPGEVQIYRMTNGGSI